MKTLIEQGNLLATKTAPTKFFKSKGIVEYIQLHVNESGVFAHHLWEFIKVIIEKEHAVIGKDLLDSSCLTKDDFQSIMKSLLLCVEDLLDDNHLECLKTFIDLVMSISASSFTDLNLDAMQVQFEIFEEQVKSFLQNLPYAHMIRNLGSLDGYGTEAVEASHISDVVKAYLATNRKNKEEQGDLNGIQKKIASHIKFYRIVDYDEDRKETIQMIKGRKKEQEHCLYDVGMGNGIKGCRWRLGGNGTGLWIFEKPTPGSTVVIPLKKPGMRAWVVPYFQDGHEGASGRVYLNSYSDRYVWSQIPRSSD
ncbi:hypothetical protein BDR26DRAFT_915141 [Obelidium mucronatum]|nr:hypothetical protein BDR26DRAFT_915141 [Obelidium mucronatum]